MLNNQSKSVIAVHYDRVERRISERDKRRNLIYLGIPTVDRKFHGNPSTSLMNTLSSPKYLFDFSL